MRFEIGSSHADIQVLLATLRGTHRRTRLSVIAEAVTLVLIASVLVTIAVQKLGARDSADRLLVAGITFVLAAFAVAMVLELLASYTVDNDGIAKKHLIPWFSWRVARADIHLITLVLEKGWTLEVTTTTSKKRNLLLEGSIRDALASLYPEVTPYRPTARDVRRWKWLAAGIVVLLAIGAAITWWLTRRGILYWP